MKNLSNFFIALFFLAVFLNTGYSQIPTYTLTAKNFKTNCYKNILEWDIFVKHTNPPTPFYYWRAQYIFNFDTSISNGGILTYQITDTDLPFTFRPRHPMIANFNGQIVLFTGPSLMPGHADIGYNMTNNGSLNDSCGTLIFKARLTTSAYFSFQNNGNFLQWRNGPNPPYPYTAIYCCEGSNDITTPSTHFIDINTLNIPEKIINFLPLSLSENVLIPVTFTWSKFNCNITNSRYKFELAFDNLFSNIVQIDSNVTDTSKVLDYVTPWRKYFWRVSGFDYDSNKFSNTSSPSTFTTPGHIIIRLSEILEGYYNTSKNQSNKKFNSSVYLREASSPYLIRDSAIAEIDSVNMKDSEVDFGIWPGNYFIVIKNLNGLETWSRNNGEYFSYNNFYNYSFNDSVNHAYGNNLKLKGSKYCIYSGDVNQDGAIDSSDMEIINEDAYNYSSGLILSSDLDGDNFTDLSDYSICENNAANNINVIRP